MAVSYTTTYNLTKPEVGASEDAWGGLLNTNFDNIDNLLDGTTAITGIDINSGSIDGTVIGANSAAAITGTTITASTSITGTLATAAQPNITSVGSLTSLDVAGSVTADGLTVNSGATSTTVNFGNSGTPYATWYNDVNGVSIISADAGNTGAATRLQFNAGGVQALRIQEGGDISFYEDTGTTAKFFWDASAESLGIGSTTTGGKLRIAQSSDASTGGFHIAATDGNAGTIGRLSTGELTIRNNSIDTMSLKSGKVGIGTSSPDVTLELSSAVGTSTSLAKLRNSSAAATSNISRIDFEFDNSFSGTNVDVQIGAVKTNAGNEESAFFVNTTSGTGTPTERLRVDASGNLLVGKTSAADINTNGFQVESNGRTGISRDSGSALLLNRTSSDGPIALFRKDGSTVGSIGVNSGNNLYISSADSDHAGLEFSYNSAFPLRGGSLSDNTVDLGYSGGRFNDLYLGGGVYLGGTGAANKLDDYEEGTWTPTVDGVYGNVPSGGASSTAGYYTKVGRLVTVQFTINFANSGTSAQVDDRMTIGGLPFTAQDYFNGSGQAFQYGTISTGNNAVWTVIATTSSAFWMYLTHEDGSVQYDEVVRGSMTYRASS